MFYGHYFADLLKGRKIMTREEYLTLEEAVKNVSLRENWYIVLPAPEKLKNFDSLGCRTVMFVVTDVPITNKDYMKSFDMIEDLHLTYHALVQNPYVQKNINILDHSMSSSLNRKLKTKTYSFTVHYVDKITETLKMLNGNSTL